MAGYPLIGYDHPDHPLQQEILRTVTDLAGLAPGDIHLGTDGCGLPVFALPLRALATAYMKLAVPERIEDKPTRDAVSRITGAMNAAPYMVAGKQKVDTLLLEDSNIVAKGGFKGVDSMLEKMGLKADLAEDGKQAVEMVAGPKVYDMIFMERLKQPMIGLFRYLFI